MLRARVADDPRQVLPDEAPHLPDGGAELLRQEVLDPLDAAGNGGRRIGPAVVGLDEDALGRDGGSELGLRATAEWIEK